MHPLVKAEKSFKGFSERNDLRNFGRGLHKEQSCEVFFKNLSTGSEEKLV